jgi:hypothetical protein
MSPTSYRAAPPRGDEAESTTVRNTVKYLSDPAKDAYINGFFNLHNLQKYQKRLRERLRFAFPMFGSSGGIEEMPLQFLNFFSLKFSVLTGP